MLILSVGTYLFQIDSDLVLQRDAGHTRIKYELDKIGIKKQEVEQSMLTINLKSYAKTQQD